MPEATQHKKATSGEALAGARGRDRPRLLDTFCGAGGCGKGFHDAGFEVVGVDIKPQPNYPYEFHQADALEVLAILATGGTWQGYVLADFAAIHASPPCQGYVSLSRMTGTIDHPKLVEPVRAALTAIGLPYVIENVPTAPMLNAVQICGGGLGLEVKRHRAFECSFPAMSVPCRHTWLHGRPIGVYGSTGGWSERNRQRGFSAAEWREAMGIDWMTVDEISQAIPPAYTEHIGGYLLAALDYGKAAA